MITQKEKQPFADFETALRTQLAYCEYECSACHASYADRMLRDKIIIGVQDKKLQLKLLDGKDDPLSKIVETCKIFEAAAENKQLLDQKVGYSDVHAVIESSSKEINEVAVIKAAACYNCGQPYSVRHRRYCPAININCDLCGRLGHFKKFCRAAKTGKSQDNRGKPGTSKQVLTSKAVHSVNWKNAE
ncbi:uncharacterized protein LOC129771930 [Toxorhynchites rutilus septentrionalis]|uniref:uncharacterized protein LOC129771930 n=1 Tax=Toxorhynchites rutilus septentrionalis TaxID=329112 RepID=UPI00247AE63C|nr:uncharacterized protein LOC129771930 [Toxorhynchites rutilus septentrionalis]